LENGRFEDGGDGTVNIKIEYRKIHWEVDENGSRLYPMVSFGVSHVELRDYGLQCPVMDKTCIAVLIFCK
jgi:hypothetical protein